MIQSLARSLSASIQTIPPSWEFTIAHPQYCPKNALLLSQIAYLAYQNELMIRSHVYSSNLDRFEFFDQDETQAFVAGNDALIVVAFRGTTCINDWMTNKRLIRVPAFGGWVHRGFLGALRSVWADVENTIHQFRDRHQPILLTGHSLGAALATLATATLLDCHMPVLGLYTFGSPRVGDHQFARRFNATFKPRTFRIVNHNDVVTRLAPYSLGYRHVGLFLYLDAEGTLQADIGRLERLFDSVQGGLTDILNPGLECINDHGMETYITHLQANLDHVPVIVDRDVDW